MKRRTGFASLLAAMFLLAASAMAVKPATWIHNTEAQFSPGKFDSAVSTSLGEIRLAREIKVIAGSESCPAVVSCIARVGKTLYVGAGDKPVIYRADGDKAVKVAELPAAMITCMLPSGQGLLVGTGGGSKPGRWRVDGHGMSACVWSDAKVKYVWAVVGAGDDGHYVATGPEGKVFAIDKAGKGQAIYEAGKLAKNVLCLATGPGGKLYAGTGEKGLIIEIDPKAKTGRVLHEASEKEIAALIVDDDGAILAATSDASKASPDGKKAPAASVEGKADNGKKGSETKPGAPKKSATTKPAHADSHKAKGEDKAGGGKHGSDKKPHVEEARPKAEKPKGQIGADDLKAADPAGKSADKPADKPQAKPQDKAKPSERPPAGAKGTAPVNKPSGRSGAAASSGTSKPVKTSMALPPGVRIVRMPSSGSSSRRAATKPPTTSAKGNAVYRVRPDGLVETIFRRPVTILAMAEAGGKLILATGNGGGIYSVSRDGDEVALIADTDAKQVTCLAVEASGEIVFGTANKGSVARLAGGFARKGTYVSQAMDARQIAKWGTMQIAGNAPAGARVTIATRSGNVSQPDDKTWSSWSKEMPLESGFLSIGAPSGRFLQYRLTLSTRNAKTTPRVSGVQIVYQVGNLAPTLAGVKVSPSEKGPRGTEPPGSPKIYRHVAIKALDTNGDKLRFEISFREVGSEGWVVITDKLAAPKFIWDTRSVGDGTYELRIEASDDPSNPAGQATTSARISEPVVVDNTAPAVGPLAAKVAGGKVVVTGQIADATSRIEAIQYSVNSQAEWHAVLPGDGICDSDVEKFSFNVDDLKPGTYRIAVRAADIYGNVGYGSATVRIGK